jgi:hypothetical protein
LQGGAQRITWSQHEQAPFAFPGEEHETETRLALRVPTFAFQPLDGGRHGTGQITSRGEAGVLDERPLEVPYCYESR